MLSAPARTPFLAAAQAVARRLAAALEAPPATAAGPPPGLAAGRAGDAWFLGMAAAARVPGADAFRPLALDAMHTALRDARAAMVLHRAGMGLLHGATGVAVAAAGLGRRMGDPELVRAGRSLAGEVARLAPTAGLDPWLGDGAAGVVLGLLAMQDDDFSAERLDVCATLGDRLLVAAEPTAAGVAWAGPEGDDAFGLERGGAGIAMALAHLAHATGRRRYGDGAVEAARHERAHGLPAGGGWAAGLPGLGLARLHLAALTGDAAAMADATAAAACAVEALAGADEGCAPGDPCIAHGSAAHIEVLLVAGEVTGLRDHLAAARAASAGWADALVRPPALPAGHGLLEGAAGTGLTALRLHDPRLAPSPALPGVPPARMRL